MNIPSVEREILKLQEEKNQKDLRFQQIVEEVLSKELFDCLIFRNGSYFLDEYMIVIDSFTEERIINQSYKAFAECFNILRSYPVIDNSLSTVTISQEKVNRVQTVEIKNLDQKLSEIIARIILDRS